MPSLADRFCPNTHDAAITAAAFDAESGTVATADASGMVAVQRPGEASPRLLFRPGGPVSGALALIRGGSLVGVGDDHGTIGLYSTRDGSPVFREDREGERGRARAMRGVTVNPSGSLVAAIAKDGLLRLWNLTTHERDAWREFSGSSIEFDRRGERLLLLDPNGHPQMFDLTTRKSVYMDQLKTPATMARFSPCGTMVVAGGSGGLSLLRVSDGTLITSFATRGGSGIQNLLVAPNGTRAAAITRRSVHAFSFPSLDPIESYAHGAPDPQGAAIWNEGGIRVGGADGLLHSGGSGSLGPVTAVCGSGPHRIVRHTDTVSVWKDHQRISTFPVPPRTNLMATNRTGELLAIVVPGIGLQLFDLPDGRLLFNAESKTGSATDVHCGGDVVSVQLGDDGIQWWHLAKNRGFSLPWPATHAVSGSGTWLAVTTPNGAIRILDPSTGKDALAPPIPLSDRPIERLAFMNRSPALLVLDADGVLGHYDLTDSARTGHPATGTDVLSINVPVDRLWGITGGDLAALRLREGDEATMLWVDVQRREVVGEVTGLPPSAAVDAESGLVLMPSRSSAVLECNSAGEERRVLRALTDGEWLSYDNNGVLAASDGAADAV
ncbi:MAG: hypothetical protein VX127_01965 [Myxococcota bacterium]|nr:hypothetical protein [Myxococcota bacterium]